MTTATSFKDSNSKIKSFVWTRQEAIDITKAFIDYSNCSYSMNDSIRLLNEKIYE